MSITTRGWGGSGTVSIYGWGGRAPTPPPIPGGGGGSYGLPGTVFPPCYEEPPEGTYTGPDIDETEVCVQEPDAYRAELNAIVDELKQETEAEERAIEAEEQAREKKQRKPRKKAPPKKKGNKLLRVAVGVMAGAAVVHGARKIGKSLVEVKDKGVASGITGVLSGGSILMKALEAGKAALGETPSEPQPEKPKKKRRRRKP